MDIKLTGEAPMAELVPAAVVGGRAEQRHLRRRLLAPEPAPAVVGRVAKAVQRSAAEVRDQEAHVVGVEHLPQRLGHGVDDTDGRCGLSPRQQGTQVEPA